MTSYRWIACDVIADIMYITYLAEISLSFFSDNTVLIIGVVIGLLLATALVGIFIVLWRKGILPKSECSLGYYLVINVLLYVILLTIPSSYGMFSFSKCIGQYVFRIHESITYIFNTITI